MKNESDTTATKKKMRISSKSLIKTETKSVASTILVSMLEADNEI